MLFSSSALFGFIGLYIPFFYVQLYSIQRKAAQGSLITYLLPLLNAGSFLGRIVSAILSVLPHNETDLLKIPNHIADKAGALNTAIICTFAASVLNFGWIGMKDTAGVIVFCILYGFFSGAFLSLGPVVIAELSPSSDVFGSRLSMLFIPAAVGVLIGNPIAGAILKSGWIGLQVFGGSTLAVAMLLGSVARLVKTGLQQ